MIKAKQLFRSILISLGIGLLSGFLTMGSAGLYDEIVRPPLSPPSWLFPFVWVILYILMGVSAYMIYMSDCPDKNTALALYGAQLFFNFTWSLIFFNGRLFLLSFIWLVILWLLILLMMISFFRCNKKAALLQIPYFLWVTFAGYLNLAIYLLNR